MAEWCAAAYPRHCERSEAIHGTAQRKNGLLRRFAPRNDEYVDTVSPSRGALRPSFSINRSPSNQESAGNAGCLLHPRSRVQCARGSAHTSIQVQPEQSGIPCAVVLAAYTVLSLETNSFCLHRRRIEDPAKPGWARNISAGLTPATGARTTRLCRPLFTPFVGARPSLMSKLTLRKPVARPACRGHRSPHPTSVTIAIRPSCERGMAGVVGVIWGQREAEYFSRQGWTGFK